MSTDNPWEPEQTDDYMISAEIYCLFFPYGSRVNYMKGMKVTDINRSPTVYTQAEVGHQLASGIYANFATTKADPGELTVKNHFEFERGTKPPIHTYPRIKGPTGTVMLGVVEPDDFDNIQIFFLCGANIAEEGGIEGNFGSVMMSATKFKLSGEPKMGTLECNTKIYHNSIYFVRYFY